MKTAPAEKIAILGLSDDPDRYAFKAAQKLQKNGFVNLVGIHPSQETVLGVPVVAKLGSIPDTIHTLTLYVGPSKLAHLQNEILAKKPRRIIFNPGTEYRPLMEEAHAAGIEVLEACTLVLLSISQF